MWQRADRVAGVFVAGIMLVLILGGSFYALTARSYYDETEYWRMGQLLLKTGMLSIEPGVPTAYKVPGIPILLAAIRAVGLDFNGSRLLFVLLLPVGAWLVWRWFASLGVPRAATAFAVVAAFANPALVASSGTLYPQVGLAVSCLAAFAAWSSAERSPAMGKKLAWALSAGLVLGLGVMLASTALTVVVSVVLWAGWRAIAGSRRGAVPIGPLLMPVGALVLGVCLMVTPWIVRNANTFGVFPLMGTNSGVMLLMGNSPATRPDSGPNVAIAAADVPPAGSSELQREQFYRARGLEHILQQPMYYSRLYLEKVAYGLWPTAVTWSQGANATADVVQRIYYALMYLGLLMWVFLKRRMLGRHPWIAEIAPYLSLTLIVAVSSLLSYAVFFTRLRYRLPADVPLALFAGMGVFLLAIALVERARERNAGTHVD
jgi:hypothetical protein